MKIKTEKELKKHITELQKINVELWESVRFSRDQFAIDYINFFMMLADKINQHQVKISIDQNDWPTITEVKQ